MVGLKIKITPQNMGPKTPDTEKNALSASIYIKCGDDSSVDLLGVRLGSLQGGSREGLRERAHQVTFYSSST